MNEEDLQTDGRAGRCHVNQLRFAHPVTPPVRRPALLLLCALLGTTLLAQEAAPQGDAKARAAIAAALQEREIPRALQAYDAATAQSGPSAGLLAPIARADLGQCLEQGKSWNRIAAARALTVLGEERGKQALVAELRSPHAQVRTRVAALVADAGLTEAVPDLKTALTTGGGQDAERIELARALYRLGEQDLGRSTLAQLSGSDDPRVRVQAVRGLVLLGDKESLATFRERMTDENLSVGLWAARGAAALGEVAGEARLRTWMSGDQVGLRVQAAWNLRGAGVTDFVPAVREMTEYGLEDPNDPLRSVGLSAYLLSWLDPEVGLPYLERVLALEGHLDTRMFAARRLAELRHGTALEQIEKLYSHVPGAERGTHRADLIRFAGWLGDSPQVREFMARATVDESEAVQLEALEVLAALGATDALGPLRELLAAPSLGRKIRAAEALVHFGQGVSGAPDMWASGSGLGPRWE